MPCSAVTYYKLRKLSGMQKLTWGNGHFKFFKRNYTHIDLEQIVKFKLCKSRCNKFVSIWSHMASYRRRAEWRGWVVGGDNRKTRPEIEVRSYLLFVGNAPKGISIVDLFVHRLYSIFSELSNSKCLCIIH